MERHFPEKMTYEDMNAVFKEKFEVSTVLLGLFKEKLERLESKISTVESELSTIKNQISFKNRIAGTPPASMTPFATRLPPVQPANLTPVAPNGTKRPVSA